MFEVMNQNIEALRKERKYRTLENASEWSPSPKWQDYCLKADKLCLKLLVLKREVQLVAKITKLLIILPFEVVKKCIILTNTYKKQPITAWE